MIEKKLFIREVYDLKHINDNNQNKGFDYENRMIERMTSEVIRRNENFNNFLSKIQDLMVWMFEITLVHRNFFNHTIHKYSNNHNN
jgi:hypothetical protein